MGRYFVCGLLFAVVTGCHGVENPRASSNAVWCLTEALFKEGISVVLRDLLDGSVRLPKAF